MTTLDEGRKRRGPIGGDATRPRRGGRSNSEYVVRPCQDSKGRTRLDELELEKISPRSAIDGRNGSALRAVSTKVLKRRCWAVDLVAEATSIVMRSVEVIHQHAAMRFDPQVFVLQPSEVYSHLGVFRSRCAVTCSSSGTAREPFASLTICSPSVRARSR